LIGLTNKLRKNTHAHIREGEQKRDYLFLSRI
jgi:hypothetical protein